MVKLSKKEEKTSKNETKTKKVIKKQGTEAKTQNKYEKIISKKRKLDSNEDVENNKENKSEAVKVKKPRLADNKTENQTEIKKPKVLKNNKANKNDLNKKFKNGKVTKPLKGDKNKAQPETPVDKKELFKQRKQKKLAENYDISVNIKKIWETLRKAETTEETKKKLCSSLFEQVKTRIKQMSFAHDTVRVIECLVQYGNENHRAGVFEELKDDLVELSKSKYGRFLLKKMLTYGNKEQKDAIINAFTGRVTKLIKHSFACQIVESLFNEHASYAQRNQMLMEFYDPTFSLLHDQKCKSLSEVLEAQPYSKEKILNNLKDILTSCIDKTILMFSIIHRVFLEFLQNCDQKQKLEMVDLLSEHLVHMVHTKDGTNVAMQCIWFSGAKERKKIIKAMKSFIVKIAHEEYGHMVLLAILDSVDDTKLVSKGILEELFRSIKEVFDNEYGRKVITYLIAPRDSKFFLKDYVKRLEQGDNTETSKKDPEKRREEVFDYSKSHILEFFKKEIQNLLYNGSCGILIPFFLEKIEKDGDVLVKKIADLMLEKPYEASEGKEAKEKIHLVEEATSHFIIKKLLALGKEKTDTKFLTLGEALLNHANSDYITSWIDCNRGCFIIVNLIESSTDENKLKIKEILKDSEKDLKTKFNSAGAKLLLEKLKEISK